MSIRHVRKAPSTQGYRIRLPPAPSGGIKVRRYQCDPLTAVASRERIKILKALKVKSKNISDLHRETALDRATVSYHLGLLEKCDIVKSDYIMLDKPTSRGRLGRYYHINKEGMDKVFKAIDERKEFLKKLV